MDLDDWLSHLKHLETGSRYMRNCPICELRSASTATPDSMLSSTSAPRSQAGSLSRSSYCFA
jgi:hypothetical protein